MKKRFTKKQLDVMKVLWESATPMIASDIVRKDDALNINTVQACLRSLIANHSIKVADIVYSGTVLTRSYAPVISRDEYFGNTCTDILGDGQKSALIASLIDTETDLDELEHLEEMIAQPTAQIEHDLDAREVAGRVLDRAVGRVII